MLMLSDGAREVISPWYPFPVGREASWLTGHERSAHVRAIPTMLVCDAAVLICTALLVMLWAAGSPGAPTSGLLAFSSTPLLLLIAASRRIETSLYRPTLQVKLAPTLVIVEHAMYLVSVTAVLAAQIMIAADQFHGSLTAWWVPGLAVCGVPMVMWIISMLNVTIWCRRRIP